MNSSLVRVVSRQVRAAYQSHRVPCSWSPKRWEAAGSRGMVRWRQSSCQHKL